MTDTINVGLVKMVQMKTATLKDGTVYYANVSEFDLFLSTADVQPGCQLLHMAAPSHSLVCMHIAGSATSPGSYLELSTMSELTCALVCADNGDQRGWIEHNCPDATHYCEQITVSCGYHLALPTQLCLLHACPSGCCLVLALNRN